MLFRINQTARSTGLRQQAHSKCCGCISRVWSTADMDSPCKTWRLPVSPAPYVMCACVSVCVYVGIMYACVCVCTSILIASSLLTSVRAGKVSQPNPGSVEMAWTGLFIRMQIIPLASCETVHTIHRHSLFMECRRNSIGAPNYHKNVGEGSRFSCAQGLS